MVCNYKRNVNDLYKLNFKNPPKLRMSLIDMKDPPHIGNTECSLEEINTGVARTVVSWKVTGLKKRNRGMKKRLV